MRRHLPPAGLALVVLGLLADPAAADDTDQGGITAAINFALGSAQVDDAHGFIAPGGHFDLGFRVRKLRLAAELETGLWSNQSVPQDEPHTGSFRRFGVALRWNVLDLAIEKREHRPASNFRGYVEGGAGRQHIDAPGLAVSRYDVMLGMGVSPEIKLGPMLFGANFGIRIMISNAPNDSIARGVCSSCTASAGHDIALLYVLGFVVGK